MTPQNPFWKFNKMRKIRITQAQYNYEREPKYMALLIFDSYQEAVRTLANGNTKNMISRRWASNVAHPRIMGTRCAIGLLVGTLSIN